jgi:DNA-binding NarL/FixJ family response regulator
MSGRDPAGGGPARPGAPGEQPIRILLAEDHQVVREGLRALLAAQPGFAVVAEAADGLRAVALARDGAIDVAVLDVGLPRLSGPDAAREIRARDPSVAVVMLSMHDDGATVERALAAGARGYVLKGEGIAEVARAIREVAAGRGYLSPAVADHAPGGGASDAPLTARERQILKLIAEGHTGRQIAALLSISPKTVENHRGHLMDKLDIHSTAGLVRYAIKAGLAE